jgi:hypothetical protein
MVRQTHHERNQQVTVHPLPQSPFRKKPLNKNPNLLWDCRQGYTPSAIARIKIYKPGEPAVNPLLGR